MSLFAQTRERDRLTPPPQELVVDLTLLLAIAARYLFWQ